MLHSSVCAWSKPYDPELQQTLDLWKSLLLTGSRRGLGERLWFGLLTGNWVTTSRKEAALLILSPGNRAIALPGNRPEGQSGLAAVTGVLLSSRGNPSFTHSFIHFQRIPNMVQLPPAWTTWKQAECRQFYLCQNSSRPGLLWSWFMCSIFTQADRRDFPNGLFCLQRQSCFNCIRSRMTPLVWDDMYQRLTISTKCKHSPKPR